MNDIEREALRRQARRDAGLPLHLTPEELQQRAKEDDDRLEREIQVDCVKNYRANGFTVYVGSVGKVKGKIQPGHPDLTLFHPRKRWHGYHEVKTPTGDLRPDQRDFRDSCVECDVPHFVGGLDICLQVIEMVRMLPLPTGQPNR